MIFLLGSGRQRGGVGALQVFRLRPRVAGLGQVDDIDQILPSEVRLADALKIGEGRRDLADLAGHVD